MLPTARRERAARAALSGPGLAVATTSRPAADRPADAVWAPLATDDVRIRLAELAGWPRPIDSVARLAAARDESWDPPRDWWRRPSRLPGPPLPSGPDRAFMDDPAERGG
ncbi:MAG TPA: hypothetical protein VNG13_14830 [Mycobacteriales bacterium]|nr:hypothetical protein [Mycobacteriales bacterium]